MAIARLVAVLRGLLRRRQIEGEVAEELRDHLEREIEAHRLRGVSPGEARRLALRDLGGLTQTTVRVTKSGLPVLMDLPLIGRLFGVTNKQETKRDLLILITPHIIDEGQPMNDGSRN